MSHLLFPHVLKYPTGKLETATPGNHTEAGVLFTSCPGWYFHLLYVGDGTTSPCDFKQKQMHHKTTQLQITSSVSSGALWATDLTTFFFFGMISVFWNKRLFQDQQPKYTNTYYTPP